MNRLVRTLMLFALIHPVSAQIVISPNVITFGTVTRTSDPIIDILIENHGSTRDYLLRHTFGHEFEVRTSGKAIEPGEQMVLRVRYNPRTKGSLDDKVMLYFASSTSPFVLPLRADVLEINPNGNLPCPDFSERPAECCVSNAFSVQVIDADDGQPVPGASVHLEEQGYLQTKLTTDNLGRATGEARIGYFVIRADKTGYLSANTESYINRRNDQFILRLKRDPNFDPRADALYIPQPEELSPDPPAPHQLLPESDFNPNNIVFLLDISGSMGVGDKLDLLKASIRPLIAALRPTDRVALVSYANDATVLLQPASGDRKDELSEAVTSLRAGGKTSGTKGFKRSYSLLQKELIKEGNNQLIVITDGAFKPEDQAAIDKLVIKAARSGMKTSVVVIRGSQYAVEKLSLLATAGNGSFLRIDSVGETERILLDELRKQSRK